MEGLHGFMPSCKGDDAGQFYLLTKGIRRHYESTESLYDGGGLVTSTERASSIAWHMSLLAEVFYIYHSIDYCIQVGDLGTGLYMIPTG